MSEYVWIILAAGLISCGSNGEDERVIPESSSQNKNGGENCVGEDCTRPSTGVACVDNAVNLAKLTAAQALRLCRHGGRATLYQCHINARRNTDLSTEDAVDLCDSNNRNDAFLCYSNAVELAALSADEALALCDKLATSEGYLCVNNAKQYITGMTNALAISLCAYGNKPNSYTCVMDKISQSGLNLEEAVSLCAKE